MVLGDLLDDLLHDVSVVVASVTRVHFNVVHAAKRGELDWPPGGGLELAMLELDLLDAWAEYLPKKRHHA
eukprot:CAMPEP_0202116086 /NCGR_PEP_ID=MMETSP0965-20130614/39830_1 /ASSEMBLY_ACC=CAM_ASM_000507 /TAXON_ID=4773 /ORGANISM="Schizochytrium aggregatum, Strain ATCC28209" /LENGTH=69 /DNA_ID=CAMNT_0048685919 /DNA_START=69 /DNA_END=275 /DNA_ORIENTATION=+